MKELKGFRDGFEVIFTPLRCPACKQVLLFKRTIVSSWPYIHADIELYCVNCGFTALFGIPEDPVVGMELVIWDTEPELVLKRAREEERPICPFHFRKMRLTKIFGDFIITDGTMRLQYKCPEWFLTHHRTVKRPKEKSTASANAKTVVTVASSS